MRKSECRLTCPILLASEHRPLSCLSSLDLEAVGSAGSYTIKAAPNLNQRLEIFYETNQQNEENANANFILGKSKPKAVKFYDSSL